MNIIRNQICKCTMHYARVIPEQIMHSTWRCNFSYNNVQLLSRATLFPVADIFYRQMKIRNKYVLKHDTY